MQDQSTTGAPVALDPRLNAVRPDLADARLSALVAADRYVEGRRAQVRAPILPMRGRPEFSAGLVNEALHGEIVHVFEERDSWAWVQLERDGYVGYVPAAGLTSELIETTHRVGALGTFVYPEPNIKTVPVMHLSLNAEVRLVERMGLFSRIASGGYVVDRHIAVKSRPASDYAVLAERLVGTPYLWGGRSRIGLDCSGLVQIALEACGLACPRDTDMQRDALGEPADPAEALDASIRGDLVFWHGHVGMMLDGVMLLHANGHHMSTVVEPLAQAAARISKGSPGKGDIIAVRRLPSRSALHEGSPTKDLPDAT